MNNSKHTLIKSYQSGALAANTQETIIRNDVIPDYWVVVCRIASLTFGVMYVYPSNGKGAVEFRLALSSTMRLPASSDTLTIRTVAMSGRWEVYAVSGNMPFEIKA